MALSIETLRGVGALTHGVQVTPDLSEADFAMLRPAYVDHGLLFCSALR